MGRIRLTTLHVHIIFVTHAKPCFVTVLISDSGYNTSSIFFFLLSLTRNWVFEVSIRFSINKKSNIWGIYLGFEYFWIVLGCLVRFLFFVLGFLDFFGVPIRAVNNIWVRIYYVHYFYISDMDSGLSVHISGFIFFTHNLPSKPIFIQRADVLFFRMCSKKIIFIVKGKEIQHVLRCYKQYHRRVVGIERT